MPWFFFARNKQIQSFSGPAITSPMIVMMNGEMLMRPVWETEKLYGGRVKIVALTTLKTTIQVKVVP